MSGYGEWIRRQEILTYEAVEYVQERGLRSKALIFGDKPPILRILLDGKYIDFRIREIKSSKVRNVWVAPVKHIVPDVNWIIHSKTEGDWLYVYSDYLLKKAIRRESDFKRGQFYYTIDRAACKNLSRHLHALRRKTEKQKQQVLSRWLNSPN